MPPAKLRVLFVCMGNICRSPTAEGVLRKKLEMAGLADRVEVDSAGTHGWHAGAPPDERSVAHARRRGYDLSALRARRVRGADFRDFDHVLAMDGDNLVELSAWHSEYGGTEPVLLLDHLPDQPQRDVPDPYSGGPEGFEFVLDTVEAACDALVGRLRRELT